jgi:hypothetical protein
MVDSVERSLGRLEGKVDSIIKSLEDGSEIMARLESRTAVLERWQSRIMGGAVVAGFVAGFIAKLIA